MADPDAICKVCLEEHGGEIEKAKRRPALYPGPRCYTHWREEEDRRAARTHELAIIKAFGITGEQYWAIYDDQGGKCYICGVATGKARRLAVDHDHDAHKDELVPPHPPNRGCAECVRALLCSPCNVTIGRYNVEQLKRAIEVLEMHPAQRVLKAMARDHPL